MLDVVQWSAVLIALVCSAYVALSVNMLRTTVAFFLQMTCVGVVLLSMGSDYLALVSFSIGVVGTMVLIAFSSVIMGNLKTAFADEYGKKKKRDRILALIEGTAIGGALGGSLGYVLLRAPFVPHGTGLAFTGVERPIQLMGTRFLNDRLIVFELIAVMLLVGIVGAALLLRRTSHAE